jgi:hypothetical protein
MLHNQAYVPGPTVNCHLWLGTGNYAGLIETLEYLVWRPGLNPAPMPLLLLVS